MPIARFQMPDGRVARFEVPEGTTPEEAQAMMAQAIPKVGGGDTPTEPLKIGKDAFADALRETLRGTDWGTRNIAAAGTALTNLWEGAKQLVGQSNQDNIRNQKIIREEAPVGAIAGDIALTAVPFGLAGKSVKATGAVGAGYGLTQPVEADSATEAIQGKALNTVLGGATGAGGQVVANRVSGALVNRSAKLAEQKARNAVIDQTLQESIDAGYKVPPSMMPDSGVTSRILEGLSGKYKTNQLAGINNQEVTNSLARKALGIADDSPLSAEAVQKAREVAYQPYRDLANLPQGAGIPAVSQRSGNPLMNVPPVNASPAVPGFNPKQALEELKQARSDAKSWYEAYNRSANPEQLTKAKAYQEIADALESELETYAKFLGKTDLVDDLVKARKQIAKSYTVERALDKGSGNVDAKVLARLFDKGKPLSDGLDTIGKFGSTFGDVARVPQSGHANPFTVVDAGVALPAGALNPLAYGLPLARVGARYGLLSDPVQKAVSRPLYEMSPALRMGGGLLSNSAIGGTVLGLNAFGQ